jgi:phosphatidate phosphatase APP1
MVLRRARRRSAEPLAPVIFRWDLDKTYLKSEFDSLRELVRIPFEKPEDKVAVPGVVPLIRGLREVATQRGRESRIYFMSASPPQIAKAIKEKLALDGIEYDGIVFKNQLQHLVRGKFRNLREHVGYKLTELLKSRRAMPPASREVLFGDDWESDPII